MRKNKKIHKKISKVLRGSISLALACHMIFSLLVPTYAMESEKAKGTNGDSTMDELINWENTSLLSLTGKWSDDVVAVANNQKKYWEEKQQVIEKDGKSIKDIWQGNNYTRWNISFIKLCLEKAKISDKIVPYDFDYENCIEILNSEQYRLFREKKDHIPQTGDLIILDLDGDKKADRFGIVQDINEGITTVIEGDAKEYICMSNYSISDEKILGYVSISAAYEYQQKEIIEDNKNQLIESEPLVEDKEVEQTLNNDTKGIADSILENNKTYIIYARSTDNKYYALTESGQTEMVMFADNKIIAHNSLKVQWTYDEQKGTFRNSQGNYLNAVEMYQPPFSGEVLQRFSVEKRQGGYIVRTSMPEEQGAYPLYLHLSENWRKNNFEMNGYEATEICFALVDNKENPIEPPVPPDTHEGNLNIKKYVDKFEGKDEYNLNLTVNGVYAQEAKNKADIIYVIDTTGSMTLSMDGRTENSYERWNGIVSSMQYMINMFNSNPNADIQHSMICFSGSDDGPYTEAEMVQNWTKDTEKILTRLNEKRNSLGGGTNYEAACRELVDGELTKKFRNDAEKVVVFISDGEPNRYYDENGYGVHDGAVDSQEPIRRAKEMLRYLTPIDMFYSVGVGSDILEQSKLQELSSGLVAERGVKTGYAHCNNTDDIKKAFDEIIRSIIKIKYDHVIITDNLSKYAELIDGTKLGVTVTDKEGRQIGKAEGDKESGVQLILSATEINQSSELRLEYDDKKKRLTLKFPNTYILEDGWEYKLTATIKPTRDAHTEYTGKVYPHVGDKNTGQTSSEQKGFYCNDKADLDYILNNTEKLKEEYPKPVIQVTEDSPVEPPVPPIIPDSNLNIKKYVNKLEGKDEYDLNLTVNGVYAQEAKNKADIIYVIDTTGSMTLSMDGRTENSYERWNGIVSSMKYMINMFNSNPNADIQHSMICFSGSDDGPYKEAEMVQYWTKDTKEILDRLNEKRNDLGGGTNYEAACRELADGKLVENFRNDVEKVVVFISDGEPNRYYDDYGYGIHDGAVESQEPIRRAKEMLKYLKRPIDMFYSVGVGLDILEQSKLQELSSGLVGQGVKTGYAHCKNTDQIKKAFDEIIRSIIKIKYDHVTITDTLSKYAELVDGTKLRITVKNKEGHQVGFAEGEKREGAQLVLPATKINQSAELKLAYDDTKKLLTFKFPNTYILEDGWEYKLTATIKPTRDAHTEYTGKVYPHVGDKNTGQTSSEQEGFYCNDKANLDYILNDTEKSSVEYPKPVIQITSKRMEKLPETGGRGTTWCYRIGILLLISAIVMKHRKRKEVE